MADDTNDKGRELGGLGGSYLGVQFQFWVVTYPKFQELSPNLWRLSLLYPLVIPTAPPSSKHQENLNLAIPNWWNLHKLWMLRWRPNPTRSSPKELRKLLRQMIRFDELGRSLKRGRFIWKWTIQDIHEYPKSNSPLAILLAPFSDPGVLQASNFFQDSEFPNNFRLRTSRNPPRGFFLGASDFVPRRMPLSSKSVHSATNAFYLQWKIWQGRKWKNMTS